MFKNCRKLFLLVFRNTQLGCQYLPIFDCDKDLSDDLQCNLLRQIAKNKPGPTSDQKMPVPLLYRADKELA